MTAPPIRTSILVIVWSIVLRAIGSCIDGFFVGVSVAAPVGFFAWLFGAASPLTWARTAGLLVGSVWAGGRFAWYLVSIAVAMHDAYVKTKIEQAERELDRMDEDPS